MNIIDHKNIDEWLFNYFEGNLNVEEVETLTDFLHKNPLLKADYEAWKNSYVYEPEMVYPGTKELMKPVEPTIKWRKWGLIVLTGIILLILCITNLSPIKEEPVTIPDAVLQPNPEIQPARHSSGNCKMEKQLERISVESKESKKAQPLIKKAKTIRTDDSLYTGSIYLNPLVSVDIPFSFLTGDQDTLELRKTNINSDQINGSEKIQLKNAPSPDAVGKSKKKSSKQKKRKKEMKIIRMQDMGF